MTYLDTGCFAKLYYPEPDSAKVVALSGSQVSVVVSAWLQQLDPRGFRVLDCRRSPRWTRNALKQTG